MTMKTQSRLLLAIILGTCPLAAQYYKGAMYYPSTGGTVVTQVVLNLAFNGNKIGGALGIGSVIGGATIVGPLTANIPVQGTRSGQNCTVTVTGPQGGAVFTGVCTATSFSGTYRVGAQSGTFNLSTTGSVPAQVAPVPVRVPAPPPVIPVPAPAPQAALTVYCGRFTGPGYGSQAEPVTIRLPGRNDVGGSIAIGNSMPGSGTFIESLSGTLCKGSTGYLAFQGTCTNSTVAAYFVSSAGKGLGHFEASAQSCSNPQAALPAPAAIPASVIAANPPAAAPIPAPAPVPPPAPVPGPVAASATLYCGSYYNTSVKFGGTMQIKVNPGTGFSGPISFGEPISNASLNVVGGGTFSGTKSGTTCQGTTSGGLTFHGSCTATSIEAAYSVVGQSGTFTATTQGCPK